MNWILKQLPGLIEKYEPAIEETLKSALIKMKASNPSETELFHTNWKKLNKVVEDTLSSPAAPPAEDPQAAAGGKRTRRKGRKHRKHRKY